MGMPILNIVSIHHNDEHIDDRRQEAFAKGRTILDGTTRRMLTTRCDGTITINVTNEGKYWLAAERLADNKPEPVSKYDDLCCLKNSDYALTRKRQERPTSTTLSTASGASAHRLNVKSNGNINVSQSKLFTT